MDEKTKANEGTTLIKIKCGKSAEERCIDYDEKREMLNAALYKLLNVLKDSNMTFEDAIELAEQLKNNLKNLAQGLIENITLAQVKYD
jgi:hypothetical protein